MSVLEKATKELIEESLPKAMTYAAYIELVSRLASEGKSTGPEQTEALTNYTVLNDRRMKRFGKTVSMTEADIAEIESISRKLTLLALTESWCGDAAPSLPLMNKIAEKNDHIALKVLLRDENLALMERFLTDGAMSIPKLILLDGDNTPIAEWGPRPEPAATMVRKHKAEHGKILPELKEDLQRWYNKDKGKTILKELIGLVK